MGWSKQNSEIVYVVEVDVDEGTYTGTGIAQSKKEAKLLGCEEVLRKINIFGPSDPTDYITTAGKIKKYILS